jgi:predicted acyltransferase
MKSNRIKSVDILRGITIAAMMLVNNPGTWGAIYPPLQHADWHGYTPTDLVFPFFLFIVGCSIAFAYNNKKADGQTYRKITVRTLKLIGLGLFLGAFTLSFPFVKELSTIRFPGVLQRIGLAFFFAAIIALNANWKVILGVVAVLLFGYYGLMGFVPLPDGAAPSFERVPNNWAMYIDTLVLGSHTYKPDYDPEGLLSTLPSIATALIGVLAGRFLLRKDSGNKALTMVLAGAGLLIGGYLWDFAFPINKALWSSSFVLVTAGWALVFLGLIHYLTDEKGFNLGGTFSKVGANALILYFLSSFISKIFGITGLHGWLYQGLYVHEFMPPKLSSLLYGLSVSGFYVLLGLWLWRRRIFIKV